MKGSTAVLLAVVGSFFVLESIANPAPLLSTFVTTVAPWKNLIANSDQVQPVYLGGERGRWESGKQRYLQVDKTEKTKGKAVRAVGQRL